MTQEHPFAYLRLRADVLKCCGDVRNLDVTEPQPDVKVATCRRCGRRHRKLRCEPGSLLAQTFQAMGKPVGRI